MKKAGLVVLIVLCVTGLAWAQGGVMKKKPLPHEYGAVTINNAPQEDDLAPVVFDHWVHRRYYTCRLCHVDIGFGMQANSTGIRAEDNINGYYCGTCHNGESSRDGKIIFDSCEREYNSKDFESCMRCHEPEPSKAKRQRFYDFAAGMPREPFGNGIDWEKAEDSGLIQPVDYIKGVSFKRGDMKNQPDFALSAKVEGMPDIIFSHSKHTVWNGCELCHPEIFLGVKKGATQYSMIDLFQGKYCGACHVKVAFPQTNCQRCHTEQPQ